MDSLEPNPMNKAGVFSKLTFMWLLPLFKKGYKKPLEKEDLFQVRKKQSSVILGDLLNENWDQEVKAAKISGRKSSFIRALFTSFGCKFYWMGIVQALDHCCMRVFQALFLWGIIKFFNKDPLLSGGYISLLFASGIVLCATGKMCFNNASYWGLQNLGMEIRVSICNLLYRKALRLSSTALSQTTVGQMVNLLSNDVNRFEVGMTRYHAVWFGPLQVIISAVILWQLLGPTCLVAVIFIIFNVPLQGFMSRVYSRLCVTTALLTDERIGLTNEVINMMKSIKMQCWEGLFDDLVKESRRKEVKKLQKSSYYFGFNWALHAIGVKIVIFLTFLVYILLGNTITAEKIFVTIALVRYMNESMMFLFSLSVGNIAEALISSERIQKFLELEEKEDSDMIEKCEIQPTSSSCSVEVNDVSAQWIQTSGSDDLKGISFSVTAGQITAVVGSIGAGKSTLFHAIMGELPIKTGSIKIRGKLAYVSQEPWLFTGTIKQNILFGQPFHSRKYRQILKACALERDLQLLPNKDQTIVGEKGDSLSGGQKARISLARAVYFDADIYLLDDPLSAVDAHVGRHLYQKCFSKFLSKKACILVTHQVQYLKTAHQIIVLQNGIVQTKWSPDCHQNINYASLVCIPEESEEDSDVVAELPRKRTSSCCSVTDKSIPLSKITRFRRDSQAWQSMIGANKPVEENLGEDILGISSGYAGDRRMTLSLMEDYELEDFLEAKAWSDKEVTMTGALDKSTYIKYLKAGGGTFFLAVLSAMFLIKHVLYDGVDYWLAYWLRQEQKLGRAAPNDPINLENSSFTIIDLEEHITPYERDVYLYIYAGLIVVLIIATFIQSVLYVRLTITASRNLHHKMFSALLRTNMSFFDKHSVGQILNRFSNDLGKIDVQLTSFLYNFIKNALFVAGSVGIVSTMNYWILLYFLLLVVCMLFFRSVYLSSAREIRRLEGIMRSPVFSHLSSSLQGLPTIRSFGAQKQLIKEFENHQDLHTSVNFCALATSNCFRIWNDTFAVGYVAFSTFSFFVMSGEISSNEVGLSVTSALGFAVLFMWMVEYSVELEQQMISVERVLEYAKLESEYASDDKLAIKKPDWPNVGNLSFQNVFLYYDEKKSPVLKNVSFEIAGGQKIGIVGRTGSGKSSILTCLLRLAQPEGKIVIDNINTESIHLLDLRKSISVISQDPILFKGTIKQNLDPLSAHSDEELWNILEEVGLKKSICNLPEGLSALVNQGGDNFSLGERQLICLARAVLKHDKILVMDEATASMDPQTDSNIQRIVRMKFADCTVMTIAHRINTIIDSDKVIVMDAGEVKEFSSPHELLQDNKSLFSELIRGTDPANEKHLREAAKEAYYTNMKGRREERKNQ